MKRIHLFAVAFVLLSLPYPLISYGTMDGNTALWWAGFVLLVVGGLLPPIAKFTIPEQAS